MSFLIAIGLYALVLFVVSFVARRRSGLPGLALVAGALLAQLWTSALVSLAAQAGVAIHSGLVTLAVTLLPALLVWGRGVKAQTKLDTVIASVVFAVLAVMLTYESFAQLVNMDSSGESALAAIAPYKTLIVTICIIFALVDIVAKHSHKAHGGHHKK